ncbi:conserved exported hypothetical protein [Tenacibaculum sp. 190524A05c]|uniref:hypothetical protein n=1 Tax=Tenacibaculum platacis TaxID=3137852 RepID=UPI0031FB3EA2
MKNLGKKLVVVLVVVFGSLALTSCEDYNEKNIDHSEINTTPGNNGDLDTEPEEETGD